MTTPPTHNDKMPVDDMDSLLAELDKQLNPANPQQPVDLQQPTEITGELLPSPERHVVKSSILQAHKETESEEIADEYENFVIEKAQSLTELILTQCAEDRDEATQVIDMIKDLIASQDKVIHGGSLSRLLQAIDTRSGINMIIVKALESQAKILSARKGPSKNVTSHTTNNAVIGGALVDILEEGMKQKGKH